MANPLVVLVTDAQNKPVQGVSVGWTVSGGGSVSSASTTTGADGRASVSRTLGPAAGQQTTTATASGLSGSPVTFVSVATNGESGIVITTNPPTNALDGEVFDPTVQPVVHVHNADGNPSVGATVTATIVSGGGSLQGTTTATTDAQGFATFGDLGIRGPGSQTLSFATASDTVAASPVSIAPLPPQATTGQWGPLVPWDIVPLHMSLLPTGKIIGWGKYEDENNQGSGTMGSIPRLWDPAAGDPTTARMVQADTMLFCSGHTGMPDGRIMVSGGHKADDTGIDHTNIFDPVSEQWVPGLPKMAFGRWYPTVTVLADGRILTMAGRDSAGKVVTIPEIWENNQWVQLPGASAVNIPYYPRNFVAPNGKIFMAGERIESRWFDVDATVSGKRGVWTDGPNHIWHFNRDYGTAAMYEPGKILYAGGGGNATWAQTPDARASTPTNTAEMIDLNQPVPQWSNAGTMQFARRHTNSTILPDGTVLVTGGTTGGGFVDINPADAPKAAELWDPKHPTQWTTLASNSVMRVYHSVSLLLPDGTVLHGASGNALAGGANPVPVPDEKNHEIFSPPYLFKGARPTITTVPASVGYGATFSVTTPNHAQVTDVRWIRLGSVTHAFDAGQRANTLSFIATATGVDVTAPASPNLAPPGYYQIFILNRNGVPSAGKMIQVH
ncbi:MAG: galactose oxidase-like domain-containing protein [Gemmatimonadales bacterium]